MRELRFTRRSTGAAAMSCVWFKVRCDDCGEDLPFSANLAEGVEWTEEDQAALKDLALHAHKKMAHPTGAEKHHQLAALHAEHPKLDGFSPSQLRTSPPPPCGLSASAAGHR